MRLPTRRQACSFVPESWLKLAGPLPLHRRSNAGQKRSRAVEGCGQTKVVQNCGYPGTRSRIPNTEYPGETRVQDLVGRHPVRVTDLEISRSLQAPTQPWKLRNETKGWHG
eukprot:1230147-Rhodomonas_salina.3